MLDRDPAAVGRERDLGRTQPAFAFDQVESFVLGHVPDLDLPEQFARVLFLCRDLRIPGDRLHRHPLADRVEPDVVKMTFDRDGRFLRLRCWVVDRHGSPHPPGDQPARDDGLVGQVVDRRVAIDGEHNLPGREIPEFEFVIAGLRSERLFAVHRLRSRTSGENHRGPAAIPADRGGGRKDYLTPTVPVVKRGDILVAVDQPIDVVPLEAAQVRLPRPRFRVRQELARAAQPPLAQRIADAAEVRGVEHPANALGFRLRQRFVVPGGFGVEVSPLPLLRLLCPRCDRVGFGLFRPYHVPRLAGRGQKRRGHHRDRRGHRRPVPPVELLEPISRAGGHGLHRFAGQIALHVGREAVGRVVATRAVLLQRLHHDPVEFAAQAVQ